MDDENLTENERETVERDDVSGEEAHRIGEFDDLRDRMERMERVLDEIRADISGLRDEVRGSAREAFAEAIEDGAIITDGEETELDYTPAYDAFTPLGMDVTSNDEGGLNLSMTVEED